MANTWDILRNTIVIADLAATDTDIEATQVIATPADKIPMAFVSPSRYLKDNSESVSVYGVMLLGYDENETTVLAGTATIQVIEEAPDPSTPATSPARWIYIGRAPVALHPLGRIYTFEARKLHRFSVRVHTLAGAAAGVSGHHLRAFWRSVR